MVLKIIGIVNIVFAAAALGVYVYTEKIYKKPLPKESAVYKQFMDDMKKTKYIETFKLDKRTINLTSRTKRLRFLDITTNLEPIHFRDLETLGEKKDLLYDILIDVASAIDPRELNTVSGKILLESRLKKEFNRLFGRPLIKKVYFSKFTIQ